MFCFDNPNEFEMKRKKDMKRILELTQGISNRVAQWITGLLLVGWYRCSLDISENIRLILTHKKFGMKIHICLWVDIIMRSYEKSLQINISHMSKFWDGPLF